jgi:AraC family transcriptional regulator
LRPISRHFHIIENREAEVSRQFKFSGEYFQEVAERTSDGLDWKSVRIGVARETSDDVTFENARMNSLTVDLSGTRRHLTAMEGKFAETPTQIDDVCLLPKGVSARFAWDTWGPQQRSLMLEFDNDLFTMHCPEIVSGRFLGGHLLPRNYAPDAALAGLVRMLARELEDGGRRGRLFAQTVIWLLAVEIAETSWTFKPSGMARCIPADARIKTAIDFIEDNFARNISLHEINAASGLNATHLITLFRRATGRTPYAYVIHRRIQEAVKILRLRRLPISQIAVEAGFSDHQQMTHAFRKHLGRTPKSFRD